MRALARAVSTFILYRCSNSRSSATPVRTASTAADFLATVFALLGSLERCDRFCPAAAEDSTNVMPRLVLLTVESVGLVGLTPSVVVFVAIVASSFCCCRSRSARCPSARRASVSRRMSSFSSLCFEKKSNILSAAMSPRHFDPPARSVSRRHRKLKLGRMVSLMFCTIGLTRQMMIIWDSS